MVSGSLKVVTMMGSATVLERLPASESTYETVTLGPGLAGFMHSSISWIWLCERPPRVDGASDSCEQSRPAGSERVSLRSEKVAGELFSR